MKILSVEKIVYTDYIVETDDQKFPTYRTNGYGYWENLMNDTWEETSNPVSQEEFHAALLENYCLT
uniref:Uncharacterized protein n=1 Tax=Candidatus Kentrum sp. LFY TaxID=2126342 RepID=A0A450WXK1_9GAMM|nr:MAG: hypothetical protein BECKLFY1418C_GA0070996_110218 [Candidatus Kentron sp. LFY]